MINKNQIVSKLPLIWLLIFLLISCTDRIKIDPEPHTFDTDTSIYISTDIIIKDIVAIRDSIFNYDAYEKFLKQMIKTNRYIFVPLDEFNNTFSSEKIIIGLRHDIDYDIQSSVRFARREHRNGIRASYYFLNTTDYYAIAKPYLLERNQSVIMFMKKIQNEYNHEIGWHNDLVTCQLVYKIDVKRYLNEELKYLRQEGIRISGSSYHGSEYCYIYKYLNNYIWKSYPIHEKFENYDSVFIDNKYIKITKFEYSDFGFTYEANQLNYNYFFADAFFYNDKRWNMTMFDWNTLKPGDRVIILTHAAFWD